MKLKSEETQRLRHIIKTFPSVFKLARILNKNKVNWALAAGSAYYIYTGDESVLDDVDIWIDTQDKINVSELLSKSWVIKKSDKHKAENIEFDKFDLFTNCKKFKGKEEVLNYKWTSSVAKNLRKVEHGGVDYFVISPEDIVLLKLANPRDSKEKIQVEKLLSISNDAYLELRKTECDLKHIN